MSIEDMHDDEIRARLHMPLGEQKIADRIEAAVVRSIPEPFDPELEGDTDQ